MHNQIYTGREGEYENIQSTEDGREGGGARKGWMNI